MFAICECNLKAPLGKRTLHPVAYYQTREQAEWYLREYRKARAWNREWNGSFPPHVQVIREE